MDRSETDSAEEPPDDGRLWVDLSRRQVLTGGVGAAVALGLGYASGATQQTIGGDEVVGGSNFEVRRQKLRMGGTLRELYVVARLEHVPEIANAPAYVVSLLDGNRIDPGTGSESSTNTIRTNLAAVHVAQSLADVNVTDAPALVMTKDDGDRLVVSGKPHQRSKVAGADRLWGGPSINDVPSTSRKPAAAFTRDNGNRVYL